MSFFFRRYNSFVKTRPLTTNMAITGLLFGAGDFCAQQLELCQVTLPTTISLEADVNSDISAKITATYDWARTTRAVAYGTLVFGPMAGKWFRVMAKLTVGSNNAVNIVARVFVDQCVFAPFVGIPLYFSCMTVMESPSNISQAISTKLRHTWWDTMKANWLVWPAVQMANLGLVPVQFRLLVVNLVSILWNCYLSMENSER